MIDTLAQAARRPSDGEGANPGTRLVWEIATLDDIRDEQKGNTTIERKAFLGKLDEDLAKPLRPIGRHIKSIIFGGTGLLDASSIKVDPSRV